VLATRLVAARSATVIHDDAAATAKAAEASPERDKPPSEE
jgi:hypothetical protein